MSPRRPSVAATAAQPQQRSQPQPKLQPQPQLHEKQTPRRAPVSSPAPSVSVTDDDVVWLLRSAQNALDAENPARAVALCGTALQSGHRTEDLYLLRGKAYKTLGKYAAAADDLAFALAVTSTSADASDACSLDLGEFSKALLHFQLAVKYQGFEQDAVNLIGQGRCYEKLGNIELALQAYTRATSVGPSAYAHFCRGLLLRQTGAEPEAKQDMAATLAIDLAFTNE
mmetsp:Transcript_8383/g.19873  ORF Transcript_8383/g.19873 Transcript_8383/m.19873 type:complete len:227 (-) Transcript_8383:445-1125(-)